MHECSSFGKPISCWIKIFLHFFLFSSLKTGLNVLLWNAKNIDLVIVKIYNSFVRRNSFFFNYVKFNSLKTACVELPTVSRQLTNKTTSIIINTKRTRNFKFHKQRTNSDEKMSTSNVWLDVDGRQCEKKRRKKNRCATEIETGYVWTWLSTRGRTWRLPLAYVYRVISNYIQPIHSFSVVCLDSRGWKKKRNRAAKKLRWIIEKLQVWWQAKRRSSLAKSEFSNDGSLWENFANCSVAAIDENFHWIIGFVRENYTIRERRWRRCDLLFCQR